MVGMAVTPPAHKEAQMGSLNDYFGTNVEAEFTDWFRDEFVPEVKAGYGDDTELSFVLLAQGIDADWRDPMAAVDMIVSSGEGDTFDGEEGLVMNVIGKLRFYLRTGRNSVDALTRPDLVESGDFPWEGAGEYLDYEGGVSGGKQESDWRWYMRCIEKLIELKSAAVKQWIKRSADKVNREPGEKFLRFDFEQIARELELTTGALDDPANYTEPPVGAFGSQRHVG